MTKSEYNFEAFKTIKTEEESLLLSLGFNSFFIDKIKTSSHIEEIITPKEITQMHTFNVAILSSLSGALISKPELSFGFTEDAMYSISYRNYGVCDYLSLIKFKESELLYTVNNNTNKLIIDQFLTLMNTDEIIPYSPTDMLKWILDDLMMNIILYDETETDYYKFSYCPEFADIVRSWDVTVKNSSDFYQTGRYKLRSNRRKRFVTSYKTMIKKCNKSDIFKNNCERYRFNDTYEAHKLENKWVYTVEDDIEITNPFIHEITQLIQDVHPSLTLVGA